MTLFEDQYDELADLVSRLRAENARLREAIEQTADENQMAATYYSTIYGRVLSLRAALKEGGE